MNENLLEILAAREARAATQKALLEKYGKPCAEAMIESARRHVDILEELDFHDICLSFKSSNVALTVAAYEAAAVVSISVVYDVALLSLYSIL